MVTQPVPGLRIIGVYGVNSTGAVSFPFLALFCRHTGVCAADFAVDMHRRLPLHGIGDVAVDIQRGEYQLSAHVESSKHFLTGKGCLSISL